MSKDKTSSDLVALTEANKLEKTELAKFCGHIAHQVALIFTTERDNNIRRIFVGLALHRIKASLKHGEWMPWKKKHLECSNSKINELMRAAEAFHSEVQIADKELLALGNGENALAAKDARRVTNAALKFVGDLSWGELLDKHGIKAQAKVGGKRTPAGTPEGGAPSNEELYQQSRDEIGGALTSVETLLIKENRLQYLADHPEEVAGVVTSLRKLADQVEEAAKPILKK